MRIKVSKEIKIGAHSYKVVYKKHLGKDQGFRGTIEHRQEEIWIDPENPLCQRNCTLLHEAMHLISGVFSIGLEDDAIDRVAEGMAEFLFNNLGIEFDWSDIKEEK